MRSLRSRFVVLGALLFSMSLASAQQVPDRASLDQILDATRTDEDFESVVFPFPGLVASFGQLLDRGTTLAQQGPGLVAPGVAYRTMNLGINWWGPGSGAHTGSVLSAKPFGVPTLFVDYAVPVPAAGMDVLWPMLPSGATSATVTFKDSAGVVLGRVG